MVDHFINFILDVNEIKLEVKKYNFLHNCSFLFL